MTEEYAHDGFQRPASTNYRRNAKGGSGGPHNTLSDVYNGQGYVSQRTRFDGTTTSPVVTTLLVDAEGHTTRQQYDNNLKTDRGFNVRTGRLETIATGPDNGSGGATPSIQSDSYAYDAIGNLASRNQLAATSGAAVVENFGYDALNRITSSQVLGYGQKTDNYDSNGNPLVKDNLGYAYPAQGPGSVRPHALSTITGTVAGVANPSLGYDANGNITGGLTRAYGWTSYNQPATIDNVAGGSATQRTAFTYDTEHQRTKQTISSMSGGMPGAATDTIVYAGSIEKEINATANTTAIRTYLRSTGYVEEVFTGTTIAPTSSGTRNPRYSHTDDLGSLLVISDQSQTVLQRMSYDLWGRRRNTNGSDDTAPSLGSIVNGQDHTGYTGQEQIYQLALVNFNGRIYDPVTGRMASADPTVPDPADPQHLNRYTYVLNNALAFVDPSGFVDDQPQTMADPASTGPVMAAAVDDKRVTPTGSHIPRDVKVLSRQSIAENNAAVGGGPIPDTKGAVNGATVYAGQQLGDAGAARGEYQKRVGELDLSDSQGRAALKQEIRDKTPQTVLDVIELKRPNTEASAGSGSTANRTNAEADALGKILKWGGRSLIGLSLVAVAIEIYNSDNKTLTILRVSGSNLGGLAGGTLGAVGGSLVSPGPGTVAGGIAGATLGGAAWDWAAVKAYDTFFKHLFQIPTLMFREIKAYARAVRHWMKMIDLDVRKAIIVDEKILVYKNNVLEVCISPTLITSIRASNRDMFTWDEIWIELESGAKRYLISERCEGFKQVIQFLGSKFLLTPPDWEAKLSRFGAFEQGTIELWKKD